MTESVVRKLLQLEVLADVKLQLLHAIDHRAGLGDTTLDLKLFRKLVKELQIKLKD